MATPYDLNWVYIRVASFKLTLIYLFSPDNFGIRILAAAQVRDAKSVNEQADITWLDTMDAHAQISRYVVWNVSPLLPPFLYPVPICPPCTPLSFK